jgi:glutaredoxin
MLRVTTEKSGADDPLLDGMPSCPALEVVLYTRAGCPACQAAERILERHGLTFRRLDIDADPQLSLPYTGCVPVVEIDGKVRFRGRVNAVLLRRILRQKCWGA